MKIFKKTLALILCLICVVSCCVFSVSAADTEATSVGATDTKLYFQVPADWQNYNGIYCYIYNAHTKKPLANWQAKRTLCSDEGNGIWSYDPYVKVGGLSDSTTYCVIFSTDTGMQIYETVMTTACLGDTLYCDGTKLENPANSDLTSYCARWKENTQFGPVKTITSMGNIVGETYIESPAEMLKTFLKQYLANTQTYSGKTDQEIIDDIKTNLGLSSSEVADIIKETGAKVNWSGLVLSDPMERLVCGISLYAGSTKKFDGTINASNIDSIVSIACFRSDLFFESFTKDITTPQWKECNADSVRYACYGTFGIMPDLSLSKNFNPENNTIKIYVKPLPELDFKVPFDVKEDYGITIVTAEWDSTYTLVFNTSSYLVSYNITNIVTTPNLNILGDTNGDEKVNIKDATTIQKYVAGIITTDDADFIYKNADTNLDGKVNIKDATTIQKFVAGIITSFK